MDTISRYTGQADALTSLEAWFGTAQVNLAQAMVIAGPTGSGKTWVLEEFKKSVEPRAKAIILSGDRVNADRPLKPFSEILRAKIDAQEIIALLPELASLAPYGDSAKKVLEVVLDYVGSPRKATQYLGDRERDIILKLCLLVKKHDSVVLLLDDLAAFDVDSLRLVKLLLSHGLDTDFPLLRRLAFVISITDDTAPAHRDEYLALADLLRGRPLRLHYCERTHYENVLRAFGMRGEPSLTLLSELYDVTAGHLALAPLVANAINDKGGEILEKDSLEAFGRRLLARRLKLFEKPETIEAALKAAAIIGLTFSREEFRCLSEAKSGDDILGAALKCGVVARTDVGYEFTHEVFRDILSGDSDSADLHARFARCLKKIRPSDYLSRATHCFAAGDAREAMVLAAHHHLQRLRAGYAPGIDGQRVPNGTAVFQSLMVSADQLLRSGRYDDALRTLESIDRTLPESLLVESDILKARCLLKTLRTAEQHLAIKILQEWGDWDAEPEVRQRLDVARIVACGFVGLLNDVANPLRRVKRITDEFRLDYVMKQNFEWLRLKANSFMAPEPALNAIEDAVSAIVNAVEATPFSVSLQYVGLTNLIAAQTLCGLFEEACETAVKAASLTGAIQSVDPNLSLTRLDILANNTVIAQYRNGLITASEGAAALLNVIEHNRDETNDTPLLHANRIGFETLSDTVPIGVEPLREALRSLGSSSDSYYRFYLENNLCAALLRNGDIEGARSHWANASAAVEGAVPTVLGDLRVRDQVISDAIARDGATYASVVRAMEDAQHQSLSRAWKHVGHLVLLSDLQIWTDD